MISLINGVPLESCANLITPAAVISSISGLPVITLSPTAATPEAVGLSISGLPVVVIVAIPATPEAVTTSIDGVPEGL